MLTKTTVQEYMTPSPHTINSNMPLNVARDMMKKYGLRHLPVQEGGRLVGLISDRDIKLAFSFPMTDTLLVSDVMTADPYSAGPEAPIHEVADEMARRKYGCAVVQDGRGKVVGIFTATDGLRAFSEAVRPGNPDAKSKGDVHELLCDLD